MIDLTGVNEEVNVRGYWGPEKPALFIKGATARSPITFLPGTMINQDGRGFGLKIIECEMLYMRSFYLGIRGGVQVIGSLRVLDLIGVHVAGGDVGLHMTQHTGKEVYRSVSLKDCSFNRNIHEGIYIGKSKTGESQKIASVLMVGTEAVQNGWDGGQVGMTEYVKIKNCTFSQNGKFQKFGQDKDLNINPGCGRVDIENSYIGREAQFMGAEKVFYHG